MACLRDSWRTSLPDSQQPRNPSRVLRPESVSFRGCPNGASHVHRSPGAGQCMMISAGWYYRMEAHLRRACCSLTHSEAAMHIKASDVGAWLRQRAGKRDHRDVVSDDDTQLVLRPGPNFDLLLGLLGSSPTA